MPPPPVILRTNSSGVGRSATWVMRMIAISAAIIAFGAALTSSKDFSSICQSRVKTRIGRVSAINCPRDRSSADTVGSSAASGVILTTLTQCVISAKSRSTASGSAPSAYCAPNSVRAPAALPRKIISSRSNTRPRSAKPSMARTCSAVVSPAPWLMAWSNSEVASRAEPSAARVINAKASAATCAPSVLAIFSNRAIITSGSIRRRSNRWQRDSTVTGTLRISVVAKMNLT